MACELSAQPVEAYRVPSLPSSFYYIPEFVTPEEEAFLLSKINDPKAKWLNLSHRRLQVYPSALTKSNVLLLNPQPANNTSSGNSKSPLPSWLTQAIQPKFDALRLFDLVDGDATSNAAANDTNNTTPHPPNHCLINEYPPGRGIMPHEDGPAYHPLVATVSLGSHTVLDLYRKPASPSPPTAARESSNGDDNGVSTGAEQETQRPTPAWRVLQEPRSLLVTTGAAYADLLHGIADVCVDADLCSNAASAFGGGDEHYDDGDYEESSDDHDNYRETNDNDNDNARASSNSKPKPKTAKMRIGIANWDQLGDSARFAQGTMERETRVSLTFRRVVKVKDISRTVFGLGGGGKK